jgi:hypothetical protein
MHRMNYRTNTHNYLVLFLICHFSASKIAKERETLFFDIITQSRLVVKTIENILY